MGEFFRRILYLLQRNRFEQELASDMEFHREMAAREGRANFGNELRLREESRDAWGWTWIDRLRQDVRYALRTLTNSPGFTLCAILMLAIGIGVNVAAFGFFDLMVLRPLNVKDPETLLRFHRRSPEHYAFSLPYPQAAYLREHTRTLSAVLALHFGKVVTPDQSEPLSAHFVTGNFFHELGANPLLGRLLDRQDEAPSAQPVVVLTHGFWRREMGADSSVLGRTIRLNGKPATIVGVAAENFTGLSMNEPALWAPITQQPYYTTGSDLLTSYSYDSGGVMMWGRVCGGVTPRVAEEELTALNAALRAQHPEGIWKNEVLVSQPGGFAKSLLRGGSRGSGPEGSGELYIVLGLMAALVVLILSVSCANLGSLLLARGVARDREIAIRMSVGAGMARLVRQLLTESLVLALMASLAGLGLGYAVLRTLLVYTGAPLWFDATPDWRVVAFAMGIGFVAAVMFGLAPALQTARRRHRTSVRHIFVGVQVAASCVLLLVAGLLVRALTHASSADPGFDYRHVIALNPDLAGHGYSEGAARAYLESLQSRLQAIPGVESTALSLTPPLGNRTISGRISVDEHSANVELHRVSPEFFHTLSIGLLRGRPLHASDTSAVVVSESLARTLWPGKDPLGKVFSLGGEYTVVGVARNARLIRPENSDSSEAYFPIPPGDVPAAAVVIRSSTPAQEVAQPVADAARSVAPDVFPAMQILSSRFQRKIENAERTALVASVLGGVAHLLACLGIVGIVAYAVSQRTKEIGLRMALGARQWNVLSVLIRQFSTPVLVGLVAGLAASAALARLLRNQLFGLSHLDPAAYIVTVAIFLATIAIAAAGPARRALRINPMVAIRHD